MSRRSPSWARRFWASRQRRSCRGARGCAGEGGCVRRCPALTAALAAEYRRSERSRWSAWRDLAFGGMLVVPLAASAIEKTADPGVALLRWQASEQRCSSQTLMPNAAATERVPVDPANLKLVMDVELNVSLRFGQRQLPLREVLELSSGSVVELDRQVDEPVELLLDGKVIARGEAVIVDGNYGLRVTEIPQPMASHFIR